MNAALGLRLAGLVVLVAIANEDLGAGGVNATAISRGKSNRFRGEIKDLRAHLLLVQACEESL
jgi:hypothetical protein